MTKTIKEMAEESLRKQGFNNTETRGIDWRGGYIEGVNNIIAIIDRLLIYPHNPQGDLIKKKIKELKGEL